jgi:hypothetical protein
VQFHPFWEKEAGLVIVNWAGTTSVIVAPAGKSPEYCGVRTKLKESPTKTEASDFVFTMETSVPASTGMLTEDVLFAVRLSGEAAPTATLAVLVNVLPPATPAIHGIGVTLVVAPFARVATLQVTAWPSDVHPAGKLPVIRQFGGSESVMTIDEASSGPLLVKL